MKSIVSKALTSSKLIQLMIILLITVVCVQGQYNVGYATYLKFHWKGALTSNSINMKAFPTTSLTSSTKAYLVAYKKSGPSPQTPVIIKTLTFTAGSYPVAEVTVDGLVADTQYYYGFVFKTDGSGLTEAEFTNAYGTTPPTEFSFHTVGMALNPYTFSFGFASCAQTDSASPVFTTIKDKAYPFFIHMGDLHYGDIVDNNKNLFLEAYHKVFASSTQKPFFESTPFAYVWDDHDFAGPRPNGTSPGKPAVTDAYKEYVPYGTLKNNLPADDSAAFPGVAQVANTNPSLYLTTNPSADQYGIYKSFIVGRCLFIIMDLLSFREITVGDMLGTEQFKWLENQFRFASNNEGIKQVFIVSSLPWISVLKDTDWTPYKTTQEAIGNWAETYLTARGKKIILLAGDAHMLALDDGTYNNYGKFPVVQAASLDRSLSCKGGPYKYGVYPGKSQFGEIKVTDNGGENLCVKITLNRLSDVVVTYDTCNPGATRAYQASCLPEAGVFSKTNTTNVNKIEQIAAAAEGTNGYMIAFFVLLGVTVAGVAAGAAAWLHNLRKGRKGKKTDTKYDQPAQMKTDV